MTANTGMRPGSQWRMWKFTWHTIYVILTANARTWTRHHRPCSLVCIPGWVSVEKTKRKHSLLTCFWRNSSCQTSKRKNQISVQHQTPCFLKSCFSQLFCGGLQRGYLHKVKRKITCALVELALSRGGKCTRLLRLCKCDSKDWRGLVTSR